MRRRSAPCGLLAELISRLIAVALLVVVVAGAVSWAVFTSTGEVPEVAGAVMLYAVVTVEGCSRFMARLRRWKVL